MKKYYLIDRELSYLIIKSTKDEAQRIAKLQRAKQVREATKEEVAYYEKYFSIKER